MEVVAAGVLEDAEAELVDNGEEVVEDVGLDALVGAPADVVGEDVDFQGDAVFGGLELADELDHLLVDLGVCFEVGDAVGAEGAEVGEAAAVAEGAEVVFATGGVFGGDLFEFGVEVGLEEAELLPAGELFFGGEGDGAEVDLDGAFDAAAAAFLHAAPVFERFGDEGVGGDGGDGAVPVADLDGGEGDVDDVAVGAGFGHFDPVADADHLVDGDLDAGDEAEEGIAEDEDEDGHDGAEAGEEVEGGAVEEDGEDEDGGDEVGDEFDRLDEALDGDFVFVATADEDIDAVEEGAEDHEADDDEVDIDEVFEEEEGFGVGLEGLGAEAGEDEGGGEVGEAGEDAGLVHDIIPVGGGAGDDGADGAEDDAFGDEVGDEGEEDEGGDAGELGEEFGPVGGEAVVKEEGFKGVEVGGHAAEKGE